MHRDATKSHRLQLQCTFKQNYNRVQHQFAWCLNEGLFFGRHLIKGWDPYCIESLKSANSVGNIKTSESLQKKTEN